MSHPMILSYPVSAFAFRSSAFEAWASCGLDLDDLHPGGQGQTEVLEFHPSQVASKCRHFLLRIKKALQDRMRWAQGLQMQLEEACKERQ